MQGLSSSYVYLVFFLLLFLVLYFVGDELKVGCPVKKGSFFCISEVNRAGFVVRMR